LILLNASYGLAFAGLLLLGGRLADRFGGRCILVMGLIVFAAASLAVGLASGYSTLLTTRFAQGVGAAMVAPAAVAVLRTLYPSPAEYGRAMANWGGLSVLGATAGNLLSGVICALASWRWSLAIPFAVAVVALALGPRLLPAPSIRSDSTAPTLDLAGAALGTVGITLASYGLVLTEAHRWFSADVMPPLLAGSALLGTFLLVERRVRDPLLPPLYLLHPSRGLAVIAIGLTAAGTATTFVLFSLHLQQVRGYSPWETSFAFIPFAVSLLAASRKAGPLIDRFTAHAVTAAGLGVAGAGLFLLSLTGFQVGIQYQWGMLPGLVVLPIGAAASFAGASVLAVEDVSPDQAGLAGGVMNTAMELGPTIVLAALLTIGNDAGSLALAGIALSLSALLVATRRPQRRTH
ncbi:MFS transporter, partial [Streptomyces sp900116325]|uniref:MFS transporter n=1 Tax=Streptomyces sp. 900116325 TaxID=3154295 RepID=UPI003410ADFA